MFVMVEPQKSMANPSPQPVRRTSNFHPSVWGDYFLTHAEKFLEPVEASVEKQHKELEEEVRTMLEAAANNPSRQLNLIDQIQRLGVAYHFESEIDKALEKIYNNYDHAKDEHEDDIHTLALRFRLLRQHGYNISGDIFTKLVDNEGNIKESLAIDIQGMLSLFEATHLRVHSEKILDKAVDFTTSHLRSMLTSLDKGIASQVTHALNEPIRKSLTRVEARRHISLYKQHNMCHDERLLEFAVLDFNLLQKVHQRELVDIMRWWKDLDFHNKMPFARERIVETYFWALGVYFEPRYWLGRKIITKIIYLTSYVDDIYDAYGTYEELIPFTVAAQRWDGSAIEGLPDYMKICYQGLLDFFQESEEDFAKEGNRYRVNYFKTEMQKLMEAYLDEAKWPHEGYIPTMDEYMKVALVTGAYRLLAVYSVAGMDQEFVTKEVLDLLSSEPLIVRASAIVCRLTDDIVGDEFEDREIPTAAECYMKEYGTSKQEACAIFKEQVSNAWKDMNQECLRPTAMPMPILERVLNLARVIDVLYRDINGYTISKTTTKDLITSVLVDAVEI